MSRKVTIVMYHYVRDLEHSRFPAIKGLSVERFCRQLDYIQTRFTPITVEDLMRALSPAKNELPKDSILLTFDDGYIDHFANVFPLLDARGIQGCFFPSAQTLRSTWYWMSTKYSLFSPPSPMPGFCLTKFSPRWRNFVRSMRSRQRKPIFWH